MKKHIFFLLVLLAVVMQGCIVKSLHPFYLDADLLFKDELVNKWIDQEGHQWVIEKDTDRSKGYHVTFTENGKDAVFTVHLFALDGSQYLDFQPIASDGSANGLFEMHLLPSHSVAKFEKLKDGRLSINWFNEEWLKSLFLQNRVRIAHEIINDPYSEADEGKSYVITASTPDLRKFLIKYGNDPAAFKGDDAIQLILKRAI